MYTFPPVGDGSLRTPASTLAAAAEFDAYQQAANAFFGRQAGGCSGSARCAAADVCEAPQHKLYREFAGLD